MQFLKILNKFIFIFLLLFLVNINKVFASVNITTQTNTTIQNWLSSHTNKTVNDFKNTILDYLSESGLPASTYLKDMYIIINDSGAYSDPQTMRIFYLTSDLPMNIALNYTNQYIPYFRQGQNTSMVDCFKDIYFNSSYEISRSENWVCSNRSTYRQVIGKKDYIFATNYDYFTYTTPTWYTDDFSIDNGTTYVYQQSQIPVNFKNGTTYDINVTDYFASSEPIIYQPQIEYFNGYNKVNFYIDNYSPDSVIDGYFVRIVNNTDGTFENISPDINNINQIISKNYYENVNLSIQIHDRQYNILSEYNINTNINFSENSDYSIRINSVSNEQKIVYYDYIIKNNNNVKCFYSINNSSFVEDTGCTNSQYTYYLQLNDNGNITWEIRDLESNVLYNYSQNFVFNVSSPFISFKDNFNNDFLNLDILINRFQNGDIVEYSLNNSTFIEATYLEDYSQSQNIKYFTLNNISNNDLVIVRVKRNNTVITTARYRANYVKYSNSQSQNINLDNLFNRLNINNINEKLKEYIQSIGNLIINSKLGNLILLETFILVVEIVLKMIRG